MGFDVAMRSLGIEVAKAPVGDRNVLDLMRLTGAVLGGEQSGHIIFLEHATTGDGLITALQLAYAVVAAGRPLSELAGIVRPFPQVLLNVSVTEAARAVTDRVLLEASAGEEAALAGEGRVLVRASGTEPLIRVMVEARDEKVARAAAERLAEVAATLG